MEIDRQRVAGPRRNWHDGDSQSRDGVLTRCKAIEDFMHDSIAGDGDDSVECGKVDGPRDGRRIRRRASGAGV